MIPKDVSIPLMGPVEISAQKKPCGSLGTRERRGRGLVSRANSMEPCVGGSSDCPQEPCGEKLLRDPGAAWSLPGGGGGATTSYPGLLPVAAAHVSAHSSGSPSSQSQVHCFSLRGPQYGM